MMQIDNYWLRQQQSIQTASSPLEEYLHYTPYLIHTRYFRRRNKQSDCSDCRYKNNCDKPIFRKTRISLCYWI